MNSIIMYNFFFSKIRQQNVLKVLLEFVYLLVLDLNKCYAYLHYLNKWILHVQFLFFFLINSRLRIQVHNFWSVNHSFYWSIGLLFNSVIISCPLVAWLTILNKAAFIDRWRLLCCFACWLPWLYGLLLESPSSPLASPFLDWEIPMNRLTKIKNKKIWV